MPTLLVFTPHPDDEAYAFGGLIALAARHGWRCVVECASAGERGKRHDGGATDRDSVAAARVRELVSACEVLGAVRAECWGLPDGELGAAPSQAPRVRECVVRETPALVATLGADGSYGHPDHLAVYRWVLAGWRSLTAPPPLLLAAFPRGLFLPQYEKCIGMMGSPPEPPAAAIGAAAWHYELDIREAADLKLAAVRAHRSQLPGGDPEALFPPGIVRRLMAVERFSDASGSRNETTAGLLASLGE